MKDWSNYVSDYKCNELDCYEWKISDQNILKDVKLSSNGATFFSDLFELFGIKMYLDLAPNGIDRENVGDSVGALVGSVVGYRVGWFVGIGVGAQVFSQYNKGLAN